MSVLIVRLRGKDWLAEQNCWASFQLNMDNHLYISNLYVPVRLPIASSDFFFAEERLRILAEQKEVMAAQKSNAGNSDGQSVCPSCDGEIATSMPAQTKEASTTSSSSTSTSSKPRYVSSSSNASLTESSACSSNNSSNGDSSSSAAAAPPAASGSAGSPSISGGAPKKVCNCTDKSIAEATSNLSVWKGKKKPHGMISFQDLNKEISRRWKLVKPEDLARYKDMAKKDTVRYREEMKVYREEQAAAMNIFQQQQGQINAAAASTAMGKNEPAPQGGNGINQQQLLQPQAQAQLQNQGASPGFPLVTNHDSYNLQLQAQLLLQQGQQQAPRAQFQQAPAPAPSTAQQLASLLPPSQIGQQPSPSLPILGPTDFSSSDPDSPNAIIAMLLRQLTSNKPPHQSNQASTPQDQLLYGLLRQYLQQQINQHQQQLQQVQQPQVPVPAPAMAPATAPMAMAQLPSMAAQAPPEPSTAAFAAALLGQYVSSNAGSSSNSVASNPSPSLSPSDLLTPGSATAAALAQFGLQQLQQIQEQQPQSQPSQQVFMLPPSQQQLPQPQTVSRPALAAALSSSVSSPSSSANSVIAGGGSREFANSTAYLQQVLDAANRAGDSGTSVGAAASTSVGGLNTNFNQRDGTSSTTNGIKVKKVRKKRRKTTTSSNSTATDEKSSDTSSEASFSSMSTLATVKDQPESKKSAKDSSTPSTSSVVDNDSSLSSSKKRQLPINVDKGSDSTNRGKSPTSSSDEPPNKKVRVIDPAEKHALEKQSSDLDSGDLSSASDWGSNEDVTSFTSDNAGTLSVVKSKRMYTSEMSSVSASGSDRSSDTGSDNGSGCGTGGDKVETDSHTSIASLLHAARSADKKGRDE